MQKKLLLIVRILCGLILLNLLTACTWFEKPPEHQYNPEELLQDFDFLTDKLAELVPSIGLYVDQQEVKQTWHDLRGSLASPMTDLQLYPILKQAIAAVEEGHIFLSGWNDEDSHVYQRMIRDGAGFLPIQFRVLKDGVYVWQNRSDVDEAPQRGDRLISINGESAESLLHKFSSKINVDAGIENAKRQDMDLIFRVWYYLFHAQPSEFVVVTENVSGEIEEFRFQALSLQQQSNNREVRYGPIKSRPPLDGSNFYEQEIWAEQSAMYLNLLSYHGSLLHKHDVNPRDFWREMFTQINTLKLTNLVIDLRENRGGRNEFVWGLLPYVNQNKLSGIFSKARAYDGEDHGTKLVFDIPAYDESLVFSGRIYVLINGNTYSNGSMTAMALKEFANATLIGSETASRYHGFAASSWESFNLPNTNIPVRIPFFVTEYPVAQSQQMANRGVMPDVEVQPTISDLIDDRDLVKLAVQSLLQQQN